MANWDLKILDSDYIQKTNFKFKLRDSQPTELSGLAITNFNQMYPILFSETILIYTHLLIIVENNIGRWVSGYQKSDY